MGLPSMTLTRERVIMDLVEAPIALRLEWPRNVAIDLAHRIERALLQPEWTYYSQRRLRDIKGSVLLDEATEAKDVVPSVSLNVGDVPAPLLAFDVSPARMPSAPPLALEVIYRWRRVPQTAPKEAGKARIVQDWMRLDEWMRARGDALRGELDGLDKQTGLLSRLRRWLPSWDDAVNARRRLRDELDEIGEVAPSQVPAAASDRVTLLMGVAGRMEHLRREAHDNRQTAEDAEAQDAQRAAWQARIDDAKKALSAARAEMAAAEKAGAAAVASEESAQSAIDAHIAAWRVARAAELARETITLEEALSAARVQREALNAPEPVESGEAASTDPQIASEGQQGKPGKNKKDKKGQKGKTGAGEDRREAEDPAKARYDADRRIKQAQQAVERNQREREAIAAQSPPAAELRAVTGAFVEARQATERCKAVMDRLAGEIRKHEGAAAEAFRFAPPARLASLQTLDAGPRPPPVPTEALPELGELLEHHGQRFLALRTWEQVKQAKPVADRLRAELVVDASHLKRSMA